jgi:bifunctional DNA-binding transcriptional regulator/antitoxin component of YhaV-PrlF toxin-antitoxin module
MNTVVKLDGSNRIVLSREVRRAAGIQQGQKLNISASPGQIILEVEPNVCGRIVRRGTLKVWTGKVPHTPLNEAIESARRYER